MLKKKVLNFIKNRIQHYNPETYWKKRQYVIDANSSKSRIIKLIYLYQIKKSDAFNNASMGTDIGFGAQFIETPILPHGLNGIIIHPRVKIGKGSTIHQQVTIGRQSSLGVPKIGDNCYIGAGAKIIGDITIGDDVNIGANCVVTYDVPDNCTIVGVPAVIVKLNGEPIRVSLKKYWLENIS